MRTILPVGLVAAALAGIVCAAPAAAQPARVFVSGAGSDSHPCSFALSCRTFQHAHDTAATGGEIDVLDPAGYGPVAISKSISIQGHGFAGIAVASGATGVTISGGVVNLAGLLLDGGGIGATGILVTGAQAVTIAHTTVRGFIANGIDISVGGGGTTPVVVSDTRIFDIGNAGIRAHPISLTLVSLRVTRTDFHDMPSGIFALASDASFGAFGIRTSIDDCELSSFTGSGIELDAAGGGGSAPGVVHLNRTNITQATGAALLVQGGSATAWLYQSTFTDSTIGVWATTSAVVNTLGNNEIQGNGTNCELNSSATACTTALTSQKQN